MRAMEVRGAALRCLVVGTMGFLYACASEGGVDTPPPTDAGTMSPPDLGRAPDSGPPAPPPYQPTAASCQGTPPACSTYDESRTGCEGVLGCNYGRCEYDELSCLAFYSYQCETGCYWDHTRERCSRISYGCDRTSPESCFQLEACRWSSTNTSIFDYNNCLGTPTPCASLTLDTCDTQQGCAVGCPAGREQCGASCVDPLRDADHCGACGNACGEGASCVDGACECDAIDAGDACTTCPWAPTNGCPNAGELCVGGQCECPASAPDVCNATCVDVDTDRSHCGACGTVCDPALVCTDGTCGCPMDTHVFCDDVCVDPRSNTMHCGGCGLACDPGETCTETGCVCLSALVCDGVCMPVDDDANCGSCGRVCAANQHCSGVECVCDTAGLSVCGELCVQTLTDEAHCGDCDAPCRATEVCSNGACACPAGASWCDGVGCVNLREDESHCGMCGSVCPNTTSCVSGSCSCSSGAEAYCASADRCVNVYTDEAHCGACDVVCENSEVCSNRSCRCPTAGQDFCASEGQCVDTVSNVAHCGACDNACRTGESCQSGSCRCPAGQAYCDAAGSCIDIQTDKSNCGACGNVCATDSTCWAGVCDCYGDGKIHCDSTCVDPFLDESHCGSCGAACDPGDVCLQAGCYCPAPSPGFTTTVDDDASVEEVLPRIAALGSTIGVAWSDRTNGRVQFQRFDLSGSPVGPEIVFGTSALRVDQVDLVSTGGEFALSMIRAANGSTPRLVRIVRIDANGAILSDASHDFGLGEFGTLYNAYSTIAWAPGAGYIVCTEIGVRCGVVGPTSTTTPAQLLTRMGQGVRAMGDSDGTFWVVTVAGNVLRMMHLDSTGAPIAADVVATIPRSPTGESVPVIDDRFALAMDAFGPIVFVGATERQRGSIDELHDFYIVRGNALSSVTRVYRSGTRQTTVNGSMSGLEVVFDGTSYFVGWTRAEGTNYLNTARYLGRFEIPPSGAPPISVTPFDLSSALPPPGQWGGSMALANGVIFWAYHTQTEHVYFQTVPITDCAP